MGHASAQYEMNFDRNYTDAQIAELAEFLTGTPQSLEMACVAVFGNKSPYLTIADCDELDQQIFECEKCGWWCGLDELGPQEDENVCDQCAADVEDDE